MRDPRVEQWMNGHGVEWSYENRELDAWDLHHSRHDQTRLTRVLNPERVAEYASAMRLGVEFPAVVSYILPSGKLATITGVHRLTAAIEAASTTFDTYVVSTDDLYVLETLKHTANLLEGDRPTHADIAVAASIHADRHNLTNSDAARMFGLGTDVVATNRRVRAAIARGRGLGIDLAVLPMSTIDTIGSVRNDEAFCALTRLTMDYRLKGDDVRPIAKQVREASSDKTALAHIEDLQKSMKRDRPRSHPRSSPSFSLLIHMKAVASLLDGHASLLELQLSSAGQESTFWSIAERISAGLAKMRRASKVG